MSQAPLAHPGGVIRHGQHGSLRRSLEHISHQSKVALRRLQAPLFRRPVSAPSLPAVRRVPLRCALRGKAPGPPPDVFLIDRALPSVPFVAGEDGHRPTNGTTVCTHFFPLASWVAEICRLSCRCSRLSCGGRGEESGKTRPRIVGLCVGSRRTGVCLRGLSRAGRGGWRCVGAGAGV